MLNLIHVLIGLAAVCFVSGAVARFVHHHDGTVWWRGTMGFLAFANVLALLQILDVMTGPR